MAVLVASIPGLCILLFLTANLSRVLLNGYFIYV